MLLSGGRGTGMAGSSLLDRAASRVTPMCPGSIGFGDRRAAVGRRRRIGGVARPSEHARVVAVTDAVGGAHGRKNTMKRAFAAMAVAALLLVSCKASSDPASSG